MTANDIRHYKFLKEAVVNKYKNAGAPSFQAIPYDPYIFRWASNTFYELKLFDYLDIRKREVLVRIYENLKKDPRLKFLDDPDSLKDKNEFKLPESFHQRIEAEKTKLQAVSGQPAPVGGSVANKSGVIQEAPSKQIFIANKSGVVTGVRNIKSPSWLKTFGSNAQIFTRKNLGRIAGGLTDIAKGIGRGITGPGLTGAYNLLGKAGNGGLNAFERLSSQTSRLSVGGFGGRSVVGKRVAIAAILLFFGVGALAAFAPLPGQETPPVEAAPVLTGTCPAIGPITVPYGFNIAGYPEEVGNEDCESLPTCHNGIDVGADEGSPVKSPTSGVVNTVSYGEYKGNYIEITDTSTVVTITLEHLASIIKTQGSSVTKGEIVGTVGKTGKGVEEPVLHYKIKQNGVLVNPFRALGDSATLTSSVLLSDNISQNNYAGDKSQNWGSCNK